MSAPAVCSACGGPLTAPWCRRVFVDCSRSGPRRRTALLPFGTPLTVRAERVPPFDLWCHGMEADCPFCHGRCPVRVVDWAPKTGPNPHVLDVEEFNREEDMTWGMEE